MKSLVGWNDGEIMDGIPNSEWTASMNYSNCKSIGKALLFKRQFE